MKLYCVDTKGLIHNELTKGKGYYPIKREGDLYRIVNNEGHSMWYLATRFVDINPEQADVDDTDVKVYKAKGEN